MKTVSVDIPRELIYIFKIQEKDLSKAVRESLAIELYREGKISMGKAAEIAEVSRWEMFDLLGRKKIPMQYHPEDFKQDMETLKKALR